jgi:hypothetical protein
LQSDVTQLVPIPGLSFADTALIPPILKSHGLSCKVVTGMGDGGPWGEVLIWESDVPKARRVLAKYRVRGAGDALVKIPW